MKPQQIETMTTQLHHTQMLVFALREENDRLRGALTTLKNAGETGELACADLYEVKRVARQALIAQKRPL